MQEKVILNGNLFQENIDKAFPQIDILLKQAVISSDTLSELKLLERKCLYFYNKEDVDGLIVACKAFQKKALQYGNVNSQAMSHVYLAETFSINGLNDRGIAELDKALEALEKAKIKNIKYVYTKANVLISQGNIYNDKGEPNRAAERLLKAIKSYDQLKDPEEIKKLKYLNYTNLASIYADFNVDSAAFYVQKSISMKPKNYPDDDRMMGLNYLVLGKVYQQKKDNKTALDYYLKAEKVSAKRGEALNTAELYECIIVIYNALNNVELANKYKERLKEHELITLKSKYNSLHKVLSSSAPQASYFDDNKWTLIFFVIAVALAIPATIVYRKRKNTNEAVKETTTQIENKYDLLLEMIKKDDPAFLFLFEDLHPDFKTKILDIEPNISRADMEFCILLKLNLSTKKIAQLKFLEVRTVQNKKYRIRKKLNIPQEANIYNWFTEI